MEPVCTNSNSLDEYPTQFRQATRIGINFRGYVEYANTEQGIVYEAVFDVRETDYFSDLRQHQMLGDTIAEHIEASQERFGDWKYLDL